MPPSSPPSIIPRPPPSRAPFLPPPSDVVPTDSSSATPSSSNTPPTHPTNNPVSSSSSKPSTPSLRAGIPGMIAATVQTTMFMWVSTTSAYQYRTGTPTFLALRHLYAQGGLMRFYTGLIPTTIHISLCRYGDTLANSMSSQTPLSALAVGMLAGSWRATLLPLEMIRANLQTRGSGGWGVVRERVKGGWRGLWRGGLASFGAGTMGHVGFFGTVNIMSGESMSRNGGVGFIASMVSDVVTNGFKILANNRQTSRKERSYPETIRRIIHKDGFVGLVTRGLKTRMLGNAMQGAVFVAVWKAIEDAWKEE